jgi:hypothetical protein
LIIYYELGDERKEEKKGMNDRFFPFLDFGFFAVSVSRSVSRENSFPYRSSLNFPFLEKGLADCSDFFPNLEKHRTTAKLNTRQKKSI